MGEERLSRKKFAMVFTWKKKKRQISTFMDTGSYNRNEKDGELTTWKGSTEKGGEEK